MSEKLQKLYDSLFSNLHENLKKFGTYDFFDKSACPEYINLPKKIADNLDELVALKEIFEKNKNKEMEKLSFYKKSAQGIYAEVFSTVFGQALGNFYEKNKKANGKMFDEYLARHFPNVEF